MASRFPRDNHVELRPRKGHDMTWSCDIHGEPIKFYCKDHEIPLCHPCATKDHQKPCHLDNIGDVILEMGKKLDNKRVGIEETKKCLEKLDSEMQSCAASASNHLQSINDEVDATYKGKLQSLKIKEQEEIHLINEEADEEIRIINEKRDNRIKACYEEAEKQQQIMEENQARFMTETKIIKDVVYKKMEDLKSKTQLAIGTMDNMGCKITRIKQDDKILVNEAPQVIVSLDESLSANVHQHVADYLDQIQGEVQRVKFVKGKLGGEHYARIDGYIGKWELVKSIDIPSIVNDPCVHGLISDDKICVTDGRDKACYVTNLSSEHTEKVIEGDPNMSIISCATIDSNVIVCGKRSVLSMDDTLDGYITLYDRQWEVIRNINIPKNKSLHTNTVYVDVDRNGKILAAQLGQSNIYVIDPADGKIVNTITMHCKVVYDRIQALSSIDIVVPTYAKEFTVISRSGEEKAVIHCDEWVSSWYYVNKLTNTVYITYWDRVLGMYTIGQVSCDGNIQARRIITYVDSVRTQYVSPWLVTPSGNLVACNGEKLLMYKKMFIV